MALAAVWLGLRTLPATAEEDSKDKERTGPRWYVVPNLAYDSDDGLGFGARGELAIVEPGYEPYRAAYVCHLYASLRGFHHHRLRYDRLGLGPGGRLRLTVHLAWRQWLNDGYWGIGNGTTREPEFADESDDDAAGGKRYRYKLFQPFAHITLRAEVSGPLKAFASLNGKWSEIGTYENSLLSEQQPNGFDGGLGLILSAGILYDTREPEINPRDGYFAELSGRYALPVPESAGNFGGMMASIRGYFSLGARVVFATRLMAEQLFGDIPFYEMVHWGGAVPVAGFGGFETLRGVRFGRWRAPGKAILNAELRAGLFEHRLRRQTMQWQGALLADAGIVFGSKYRTTDRRADIPVHPAVGVGLRAIYAESFVARLDVGVGLDPVMEADDEVTQRPSFGIYVVFDHAF